jgi:hypothetical protein
MMNQRKRLIAKLENLEKILQHQQANVKTHQHYFYDLIHEHWLTLMPPLLPALWWGWKHARNRSIRNWIKPLLRIGLGILFSHVKRLTTTIPLRNGE